ncbi:hypothetical protein BS47DRAFT_1325426 [Hydnum rufescens UP504]|uniref:Rab proteins geranylgeranyltransferase n=1 Tax=Hydnum rufescens UP504 TaxID=1448309 RepID=A0A9P6DYF8_9AGAM|nr:hypothetical protein BS47DRAFT_1325426 [Hydnum rufescens UP504]
MNPAESDYDVVLLGTSIASSITAAALSNAGYKVLHLDLNGYYGSHSASLTLKDLLDWANHAPSIYKSPYASLTYHFPSSSDPSVAPIDLLSASRNYSLSLSPALIPSTGELVGALVQSGVSRYSGFRLLQGLGLYAPDNSSDTPIRLVPATKEDVFKDKDMSLVAKRKLMKFLQFATGKFEESEDVQNQGQTAIRAYLQEVYSLSPTASQAIIYATAHSASDEEPLEKALHRLRKYTRSAGRYGNSPFLIGHYGGLGELAQGFCRSCAVHGGTYILGRPIKSIVSTSTEEARPKFEIEIEGISQVFNATSVILSQHHPRFSIQGTSNMDGPSFRCIAIVDGPISFPASDESSGPDNVIDTSVIIFPPRSLGELGKLKNSVTAMVTGEGTSSFWPMSADVIYLGSLLDDGDEDHDAERLLRPYLDALLNLPSPTQPSSPKLIFELFYDEKIAASSSSTNPLRGVFMINDAPPAVATFSEVGDASAIEAQRVFWEVSKFLSPPAGEEGEEVNAGPSSFWPPLDPEELDREVGENW